VRRAVPRCLHNKTVCASRRAVGWVHAAGARLRPRSTFPYLSGWFVATTRFSGARADSFLLRWRDGRHAGDARRGQVEALTVENWRSTAPLHDVDAGACLRGAAATAGAVSMAQGGWGETGQPPRGYGKAAAHTELRLPPRPHLGGRGSRGLWPVVQITRAAASAVREVQDLSLRPSASSSFVHLWLGTGGGTQWAEGPPAHATMRPCDQAALLHRARPPARLATLALALGPGPGCCAPPDLPRSCGGWRGGW
jgi:hypothetical protein